MISEISIQNFKSVEKLTLPLGRVNVLIGENGAGKSNILEAIALLGAAAANKTDHEFLGNRGVRVANDERRMCSGFPERSKDLEPDGSDVIRLTAFGHSGEHYGCRLLPNFVEPDDELVGWIVFPAMPSKSVMENVRERLSPKTLNVLRTALEQAIVNNPQTEKTWDAGDELTLKTIGASPADFLRKHGEELFLKLSIMPELVARNSRSAQQLNISRFLIYAPSQDALRRFDDERQIKPVGIRGEGLFKLLQTFGSKIYRPRLRELKESLELIGWFLDFRVPANLAPGESRLQIIDRFLGDKVPLDQRNANEGFLFLLFYFAVFLSKSTPAFFAIDNVDASLNPRLCEALMRRLVELAVKYDKQVILTTHNPAILDGLDLKDDDQRLFSIYRTHEGRTQARRIPPPKVREGDAPVRLSHAFLRGLLGGVPKNF